MLESCLRKHDEGERAPTDVAPLAWNLDIFHWSQMLHEYASLLPCDRCQKKILSPQYHNSHQRYCRNSTDMMEGETELYDATSDYNASHW